MNKKQHLKNLVTESVLNFLNDAKHWNDIFGMFDVTPELKDKIKIDSHNDEEQDIPIKNVDGTQLFKKTGTNSFGLNTKEN